MILQMPVLDEEEEGNGTGLRVPVYEVESLLFISYLYSITRNCWVPKWCTPTL